MEITLDSSILVTKSLIQIASILYYNPLHSVFWKYAMEATYMNKTHTVQVRLEPNLMEKMQNIKQQTGLTTSQVFRELLRVAQVKRLHVQVDLPVGDNEEE